ncbi:MAG: lipoprotein signal peptidase [Bacteroidetes bacterium]|nr:MAG: lipoprotein signal peptidase [Bacteroidota bacterium]
MKFRHVLILTFLILLIDQALKFWIKTHFFVGQEKYVLGSWFRLHFIENEGMAYGWKFGGNWGKMILTLFRLFAVVFGTYYIQRIIRQGYHRGFIICATLIYAGAIGNLLDSMFYGLIFDNSDPYAQNISHLFPAGGGYAGFLHGKVVDMLYFPIITDAHFPSWFPFWGGEDFEFFRPVFNVADASISIGVLAILVFQRRFFEKKKQESHPTIETNTTVNDEVQVL